MNLKENLSINWLKKYIILLNEYKYLFLFEFLFNTNNILLYSMILFFCLYNLLDLFLFDFFNSNNILYSMILFFLIIES